MSGCARQRGSGWLLADGVLGLLLGIFITATWPPSSTWVLGAVVGINLIFSGVSRLVHLGTHAPYQTLEFRT